MSYILELPRVCILTGSLFPPLGQVEGRQVASVHRTRVCALGESGAPACLASRGGEFPCDREPVQMGAGSRPFVTIGLFSHIGRCGKKWAARAASHSRSEPGGEGSYLGLHQLPHPPVRLFSPQGFWHHFGSRRKGTLCHVTKSYYEDPMFIFVYICYLTSVCFRLLDFQGVCDFPLSVFKYKSSVWFHSCVFGRVSVKVSSQ